jgi:hypothetical protein
MTDTLLYMDDTRCIRVDINRSNHELITRVRVSRRSVTHAVVALLDAWCEHLRATNLTQFTPDSIDDYDDQLRAICDSITGFSRRPTPRLSQESGRGID